MSEVREDDLPEYVVVQQSEMSAEETTEAVRGQIPMSEQRTQEREARIREWAESAVNELRNGTALLVRFNAAFYDHIEPAIFQRYFADRSLPAWDEVRAEFAALRAIIADMLVPPVASSPEGGRDDESREAMWALQKDPLMPLAERTASRIAAVVNRAPFADIESIRVEAIICTALKEAASSDARFTPVDEGKATGSATDRALSSSRAEGTSLPTDIEAIATAAVEASGDVEAMFGSIGNYVAAFAKGAAIRAVQQALAVDGGRVESSETDASRLRAVVEILERLHVRAQWDLRGDASGDVQRVTTISRNEWAALRAALTLRPHGDQTKD